MSKLVSAPVSLVNHADKRDITGTDRSGDKRGLDVNVLNNDLFGAYDRIDVTYPTTSSEVYTYELSAVDIGSITVTYTDATKADLLSVVNLVL